MRLYLAGPMSGIKDFNAPLFHAEAKRLRDIGHDVVNPAEINAVHDENFGSPDFHVDSFLAGL